MMPFGVILAPFGAIYVIVTNLAQIDFYAEAEYCAFEIPPGLAEDIEETNRPGAAPPFSCKSRGPTDRCRNPYSESGQTHARACRIG